MTHPIPQHLWHLYECVLAHPADDHARLVLGDALEEYDHKWSEFIRVQIEFSKFYGRRKYDRRYFIGEPYDSIRSKEYHLFKKNKTKWFGEREAVHYLPSVGEDFDGQFPTLTKSIISRGFPSVVRTTMRDFCGYRCDIMACNGTGRNTELGIFTICDNCRGTGLIEGLAAWCGGWPVKRIELTALPEFDCDLPEPFRNKSSVSDPNSISDAAFSLARERFNETRKKVAA